MTAPRIADLFEPQIDDLFEEEKKDRFSPRDLYGMVGRGAQNLVTGQLAGAGLAATRTARGGAELINKLPFPDIPTEGLQERERILKAAIPEGLAGQAGGAVGGMGWTLASMLAGSGAGTAATGLRSLGRAALGSVPISAAQAQATEEYSTASALAEVFPDSDLIGWANATPGRRAAFEGIFDAALGTGGEGLAYFLRNKQAAREIAERTARELQEKLATRRAGQVAELSEPHVRSGAQYGEGLDVEPQLEAARRRSRQPSDLEQRADTRQGWVDADQGEAAAQAARRGRQEAQSRIQDARRTQFAEGRQEAAVPRAERLAGVEDDVVSQQRRLTDTLAEPPHPAGVAAQEFHRAVGEAAEATRIAGVRSAERAAKKALRQEIPSYLRRAADKLFRETGAAPSDVMATIAGGGVGAAAGAAVDDENRVRGAILGGTAGALGGSMAPRAASAIGRSARNVPDVPTNAPSTVGRQSASDANLGLDIPSQRGGKPSPIQGLPTTGPRLSQVGPDLGRADSQLRLDRYSDDPTGVLEVQARATRLKEAGEAVDPVRAWEKVGADARRGSVDADMRANKNGALTDTQIVRASDAYKAQQDDLVYMYEELSKIPVVKAKGDSPRRSAMLDIIAKMEVRQDAIMKYAFTGLRQTARALNASKMMARATTDPFVWSTRIQRAMGIGSPMRSEVRDRIFQLAKTGNRQGLVELEQEMRKPLTYRDAKYWSTLIRAGMLTLPVSVLRAVVGNSARALTDVAAKPAMVGFDAMVAAPSEALVSLLTGQTTVKGLGKTYKNYRTTTFGGYAGVQARTRAALGAVFSRRVFQQARSEGTSTARAVGRGFKESQSGQALRGKAIDETLDKFEITARPLAPIFGDNAWGDTFVRWVFGSQGAMDRPFREMARAGSLHEQAKIIGFATSIEEQAKMLATTADGLKGMSRAERVEMLMQNPTPEMMLRAANDTQHAIFQNKTLASHITNMALRGAGEMSETAEAIGRGTVAPFVVTPSSIATMTVQSSPVGALNTPVDLVRLWTRAAGKSSSDEAIQELSKRASRRAGRWSTGLLAAWIGYDLHMRGVMSGSLAESSGQRQMDTSKGQSPYSINIGGRRHPVGQIQPAGGMLAFGASLAESASEQEKSFWEAIRSPENLLVAGGATVRTLLDLPFVRGFKEGVEVLEDPENNFVDYIKSKAGSGVPNIVAGLARAMDPVVREADTLLDAILVRVPGASKWVPEKPDMFGRQIVLEHGTRDRVMRGFFNVTGSRRDTLKDDPVLAEMVSVGYVMPMLGKVKTDTGEQWRARRRLYGQYALTAIENTIQSELYQRAPDLAQLYVQTEDGYAGVDPGDLSDAIRREALRKAVTQARSELTTYIRETQPGGTR